MKRFKRFLWRILEVALCLLIFIATLPFFLLSIILIQFDSPGQIVLAQKRVGKDGRLFDLYKLRTMKRGENGVSPPHTQVNDPRFSKLCRLVRATTLDEVPQLFNVIRGDMSLVGPRPERPLVVEQYSPAQREVLQYLPGLFGISQLAFREGVIVEKKIALEIEYYKNRNFALDSKILVMTPYIVIKDIIGKLNGNENGTDRLQYVEKSFINKTSTAL
jgi:lipopolysaccharide/colanic/teichoic acid biosynthesis glycosyltransferase